MNFLFFLVTIWCGLGFSSLKSNAPRGTITKEYIASFLPKNPTVVEAGAHIGADTQEMSALWPEGKIYAFEPVSKLFEALKYNTNHLKNVTCINIALSNEIGEAKMYVSEGGIEGSSSLYEPKDHLQMTSLITFSKNILVKTTTLDKWCSSIDLQKIDFLWLDMQGAEPKMLQASPEILKSVSVIYTEISFSELYEGIMLYPEYKKWLESQGFYVVMESISNSFFGDALFVKKELIQSQDITIQTTEAKIDLINFQAPEPGA